ncbi:hypothetical protein Srufu_014570 [Streptomyces libani subsp. rufus]|nr:hypothetical protein Srufu_014570 [Streptomyces libani subsp. rufus]
MIPCASARKAPWVATAAPTPKQSRHRPSPSIKVIFVCCVRIDHDEPYWAAKAARELIAEGVTVEITPRLRDAIDGKWALATDSKPWSTLAQLRETFAEAQAIFDDIRRGRLLIHVHALDGRTTVAVGTYLHSGKSVYLHDENQLRQIANAFDSPAQALVSFERRFPAARGGDGPRVAPSAGCPARGDIRGNIARRRAGDYGPAARLRVSAGGEVGAAARPCPRNGRMLRAGRGPRGVRQSTPG